MDRHPVVELAYGGTHDGLSLSGTASAEGELMRSHTGEPAVSISNGTPSAISVSQIHSIVKGDPEPFELKKSGDSTAVTQNEPHNAIQESPDAPAFS